MIVTLNYTSMSNSYIYEGEKSAILIDPSYSYSEASKHTKKPIKAVFVTHGHYDHICEIESYFGKVNAIYASSKAKSKFESEMKNCSIFFGKIFTIDPANITFIDKKAITIDDMLVKVIETPGHTNCSLSFLIDDVMFTGDALFKGGIGRYDLPTGSLPTTNKTLNMYKKMKEDYMIFPGHGEATYLKAEQVTNKYLQELE